MSDADKKKKAQADRHLLLAQITRASQGLWDATMAAVESGLTIQDIQAAQANAPSVQEYQMRMQREAAQQMLHDQMGRFAQMQNMGMVRRVQGVARQPINPNVGYGFNPFDPGIDWLAPSSAEVDGWPPGDDSNAPDAQSDDSTPADNYKPSEPKETYSKGKR